MRGPREWDAQVYDRVSSPQQEWAATVIDRLDLRAGDRVLDAGCGSGRVTAMLAERLGPEAELVGVDGSEAMIAQARDNLDSGVELVCSDLLDYRPDRQFDLVFSNATFHWIDDHAALFARIRDWLVPGGRLEAQCGGEGNVAAFWAATDAVAERKPYASPLAGQEFGRYFAGPSETEERLLAAGYGEVEAGLEPQVAKPERFAEFIEAVCLRLQLEVLPDDLRSAFVEDVMDELGPDPELDYVRLNISARRPLSA